MQLVIKIVLFVLAIFLGYMVYDSVMSEIKYREDVELIESKVIDRMLMIKEGQMAFKEKRGYFTSSFDTLKHFIKTDSIYVVKQFGDPNDTTTVFKEVKIGVSLMDTLFKDYPVEKLDKVPNINGEDTATFEMYARTITQSNVSVPVFQVTDPYPYNKQRSNPNHPKKPLRLGSLTTATYSGNWK
jgi:hypothetical protein